MIVFALISLMVVLAAAVAGAFLLSSLAAGRRETKRKHEDRVHTLERLATVVEEAKVVPTPSRYDTNGRSF